MKFVTIEVQQVSGNSNNLDRCIEEFNDRRCGNGFMSCASDDFQMIEQIVSQCTDFINEHQPYFDWCKMEVVHNYERLQD
jgi:hypothetical protein